MEREGLALCEGGCWRRGSRALRCCDRCCLAGVEKSAINGMSGGERERRMMSDVFM